MGIRLRMVLDDPVPSLKLLHCGHTKLDKRTLGNVTTRVNGGAILRRCQTSIAQSTYELTHKWAAISRVKPTRRYLLFFMAPGSAHCVPMSAVNAAGALAPLLELAQSQGVRLVAI